jgi:NADH-quinone oxidoreductase subunit N
LLSALILLAMAHDQVDDARAPEFFGALLMINAGSMLVATPTS